MVVLVNIHDAKTNFSELIDQALKGDDIVITKNNNPLIRLVVYSETKEVRRGGQLKGLIEINDNFDAPLPDDFFK